MREEDKEAAVQRKLELKEALKRLFERWTEIDGINSAIVVSAFAEVTGETCLMHHGG